MARATQDYGAKPGDTGKLPTNTYNYGAPFKKIKNIYNILHSKLELKGKTSTPQSQFVLLIVQFTYRKFCYVLNKMA